MTYIATDYQVTDNIRDDDIYLDILLSINRPLSNNYASRSNSSFRVTKKGNYHSLFWAVPAINKVQSQYLILLGLLKHPGERWWRRDASVEASDMEGSKLPALGVI
jgi:hypothetical protein